MQPVNENGFARAFGGDKVRRMPGGNPPRTPPLYCVDPAVFESIGGIVGRIWAEDSTTTMDGLLIFKPYRPSAYSSLVNVEFSMPGEEGIKLLKTKRR